MSIENDLQKRSGSMCELCTSKKNLSVYDVQPNPAASSDTNILVCQTCLDQINGSEIDAKHWFCLKDSMWSEYPVVQVMAYRILHKLTGEPWAQDLLGQLYLDEDTQKWADAGIASSDEKQEKTVDSNGTQLLAGDTVTLIKDLVVKGANFTAKRGTTVKNISLTDDPKLIEGRVNGTHIVLVAAYLKKA